MRPTSPAANSPPHMDTAVKHVIVHLGLLRAAECTDVALWWLICLVSLRACTLLEDNLFLQ